MVQFSFVRFAKNLAQDTSAYYSVALIRYTASNFTDLEVKMAFIFWKNSYKKDHCVLVALVAKWSARSCEFSVVLNLKFGQFCIQIYFSMKMHFYGLVMYNLNY